MAEGRRRWPWLLLLLLLAIGGSVGLLVSAPEPTPRDVPEGRAAADPGPDPEPTRRRPTADPVVAPQPPPTSRPIDPDLDLHGEVTGPSGEPIAGARVRVVVPNDAGVRLAAWFEGPEDTPGPETTTDSAGRFRLRLDRGACVDLVVSAGGFMASRSEQVQAGERVRVVLEPAVVARVSVVDAGGSPVPDASVRAYEVAPRGGELARIERRVVTDADGLCTLDDLRGGLSLHLDVSHPKHAESRSDHDLPAAGSVDIRVTVVEGVTLRGRVLDGATERPLEGARVSTGEGRSAVSRADGSFEIAALDPTRARMVEVCCDGYAMQRAVALGLSPLSYQAFEGPQGKTLRKVGRADEMELRLAAGFALTGRVVGEDGDPLPGVDVSAAGFGYFGFSYREVVRTGGDGRFAFSDLSRGIPRYVLLLTAPGHGRRTFHVPPPREDARDLGDVALGPGHEVSGVVRDEQGRPTPRCRVLLRGTNADVDRFGPAPKGHGPAGDEDWRRTDDRGRFRFVGVPPGRFDAIARAFGRSAWQVVDVGGEDVGGEDVSGVEIVLPALRRFEVVVRDDEGTPVEGAAVTVRAGAEHLAGVTDADGVAGFSAGSTPTWLSVTPRPGGPAIVARRRSWLSRDGNRAEVVVRRGDPVEGLVLRADGKPFAGARLRAYRQHVRTSVGWAVAASDGRFRLVVPLGEPVDLALLAGRGLAGLVTDVRPGAQGVEIRASDVPTDRSLSVVVRDSAGRGVAGVTVLASSRSPPTSVSERTGADGRVELTGLPGVELDLAVGRDPSGTAWATSRHERAVPGGVVELQVEPAPEMRGTVMFPDGSPAPRAAVTVWSDGRRIGHALTGEDGHFACALAVATAGPVRVHARVREDSRALSAEADAHPGRALQLTLRGR